MSGIFKKGENMTNNFRLMVLLWCGILLIYHSLLPWGAGESNVGVEKKQRTNFYGILTTYHGEEREKSAQQTAYKLYQIPVDNISIDGKFRQIPVYDKPEDQLLSKKMVDSGDEKKNGPNAQEKKKSTQCEIQLEIDPLKLTVTYIDLNEISKISVPDHHCIWVYEHEKSHLKQSFIEIVVTPKDKNDQPEHYLVETKRVIYCDAIRKSGPEEKKVPILALDTLEIKGHCTRDESGKCPVEPKISIEKVPASNQTKMPSNQVGNNNNRSKQATTA